MNAVLLITITVTVALVYGYNSRPCQTRRKDNNAYNRFVKRHIIRETFDRSSKTAWRNYLSDKSLCKRPSQTFMEERDRINVLSICKDRGRQLRPGRSNLCISDSHIRVYQVYTGRRCKVVQLETYHHYVIVACDIVENKCRPVHYEPYKGQYPRDNNPVCSP